MSAVFLCTKKWYTSHTMPVNHSPLLPRIAIIGVGAVGATTAYALTLKNLASEILLIDANDEKEKGEVMDMTDCLSMVETGHIISADYRDAKTADIIVITAGCAQKPGETRLDLINKNASILSCIFGEIGELRPSTIILVVANPVDILTMLAQELSGLPHSQVFGSGTTLDTARLKSHIAHEYGVSPQSVHGFVLGEHGDTEFVAWSSVTIGGVPITKLPKFNKKRAEQIAEDVKKKAYEIIQRKGATFYGIGLVIADILESVIFDQKRILPVTARLDKWNSVSNVCLGAPAIVGRSGIERHWPLPLSSSEKRALTNSANVLTSYLKQVSKQK